jgi:hypothetical protein
MNQDIQFQALLPFIIIQIILVIIALVDLSKREATKGPKLLWVFVIILVSILGPVAYFVIGRRNEA